MNDVEKHVVHFHTIWKRRKVVNEENYKEK
jgi:hypothetical protein